MVTLRELASYFEKLEEQNGISIHTVWCPKQLLNNIINETNNIKYGKECRIEFSFNSTSDKYAKKIISDVVKIINPDDAINKVTVEPNGQSTHYSFTFMMKHNIYIDANIAVEFMKEFKYVSIESYMPIWITIYSKREDVRSHILKLIEEYKNL